MLAMGGGRIRCRDHRHWRVAVQPERREPADGRSGHVGEPDRTMSPAPEPFVLSAFTMSTVSHGNFGMWRHPEDRTADYTDLRYWVDLAKLLDSGGFDALFIADAVGQLDVF